MLLRSSRRAAFLSKKADVPGWLMKQVGKAGLHQLNRVGQFAKNHPRLALGIAGGTAAGAGTVAEGIRRSELGMNPMRQQAARAGYIPSAMPQQEPFNLFRERARLADQIGRVSNIGKAM